MESSWIAITGKTPELSLAELEAQLPLMGGGSIFRVADEVLQSKGRIPSLSDLNRLGGIIKAAEVIAEVSENNLLSTVFGAVEPKDRIDVGASVYNAPWEHHQIERFLLELKKRWKKGGTPTRVFIPQSGTELPAVVVQKQLLTKDGVEFLLIKNGAQWLVAKTIWVHPFEQWAEREFGKEAVDARRGLLPHKLARIMLNLTGLKLDETVTIYDPFCGSGVVLLEARELGCQTLGSDSDANAVKDTQQNLHGDEKTVWQADARLVHPKIITSKVAVVTEPYLGPVWSSPPDRPTLSRTIQELIDLYSAALKQWHSWLPKGSVVVIIFPVIHDQPTFTKIVDRISGLGYSVSVGPLRYARSDQQVERDIVKLVAT